MGTQLILTVGTNPLPVWVAWYHLKDLKDKLPQPIKVRLVHTAGTTAEMERLQTNCQGADFLNPIQTSAGDPETVRKDSRGILRNLPEDIDLIHVHYTGGTKVMGVETVSAIEAQLRDYLEIREIRLQTSYLDPRGESGPTIVGREGPFVRDTRQNVDLEFNLIALLNGFTLGPFEHTYTRCKVVPAPGTPSREQLKAGVAVLDVACNNKRNFRDSFLKQINIWNKIFSLQRGKFSYPQSQGTFDFPNDLIWCKKFLHMLKEAYSNCTWDINAGTLSYPSYVNSNDDQQSDLEQVHKFFNGTWLEYGAYAAFKEALEKISKENPIRNNCKLFNNVYARRDSTMRSKIKNFELDVVVVLGYQIVVVSCTVDHNHGLVKQKGMEAILRARQLGGDEARAIVLCSAHPNDAKLIEDELKDEMGSASEPLQVWGRDKWKNLPNKFYNYLRKDLHWI